MFVNIAVMMGIFLILFASTHAFPCQKKERLTKKENKAMKTITTTLALILGLAIGGFAGNYYGKAQILERMVMQTTDAMGILK
jgi:hypothetical protein